MFQNNKPIFDVGKILKIEMLEEVRDFSRNFLDIRYKEYTNGIIEGCDISVDDNYISISNGIIKYNGILFTFKGSEKVAYECNNKYMMLKVRFAETNVEDGFEYNLSELFLDENLIIRPNEMEICRFKLRDGAKLRNEHVDFTDLSTEFDTVNIIHSIYSGRGQVCLPPVVTTVFAKELIDLNLENAWDINFVMMCLQSKEPIQRNIIISYLNKKLNIADRDYSNMELYNYLLQVLNTIKNTGGDSLGKGRGRGRKILID